MLFDKRWPTWHVVHVGVPESVMSATFIKITINELQSSIKLHHQPPYQVLNEMLSGIRGIESFGKKKHLHFLSIDGKKTTKKLEYNLNPPSSV